MHRAGGIRVPHAFVRGRKEDRYGVVLPVEIETALLGGGDHVDVIGEPGQTPRLLAQGCPRFGSEHGHAVVQTLVVGAQGGDRGAQLVGEVGQHAPPGVLDPFQLVGHRVEGVREGLQLGARPDGRYAAGVIARAELARGASHVVEGPAQTPGGVPGHCDGGQEGDDETYPEGDEGRVPVGHLDVVDLR